MTEHGPETITAQLFARRRPLHAALAHALVSTKVTDPRMEMLNRIYIRHLTPEQQIRCRTEMLDCRHARRAYILRGVA